MAITWQQTDTASSCGAQQMCSGGTVSTDPGDWEMQEGGTQGSTEQTFNIPAGTSDLTVFFQSQSVGELTWESGNWDVNINITTAQNNLTISGIWICRVDDTCTSVATVASDTALSRDISATGVQNFTLSGVATDDTDGGSETDSAYVIFEVTNGHAMTSRTLGVTPTETISAPIESSAPFFDVTITGTNSPVGEGDTMTVDYQVDNTGTASGTQDINLNIIEPFVLLDSFENYTVGANLSDEAAEWGFRESNVAVDIHDTVVADGTQSAGHSADSISGYATAQSNTDSSATATQTATFDSYPLADCTIRTAVYFSGGNADIAFGVPATESDFNNNCYRIRGGDEDYEPFIRRTVGGTSTALASHTSLLSSNTWYDYAIEFQDDSANSNVEITLTIWEWDGSAWSQWNTTLSATDSDYAFPTEGGIAVAFNTSSGGTRYTDYFRFYTQLGKTGEPNYTP